MTHQRLRICVLHPSYQQSKSVLKDTDPECDPSRFLPEHEWRHAHLHKATAVRQLVAAAMARNARRHDVSN